MSQHKFDLFRLSKPNKLKKVYVICEMIHIPIKYIDTNFKNKGKEHTLKYQSQA